MFLDRTKKAGGGKSVVFWLGLLLVVFVSAVSLDAWADEEPVRINVTMSPMNQKIKLTPGEDYEGWFKLLNSSSAGMDVKYNIVLSPFYVDDGYVTVFEEKDKGGEIVKWTKLTTPSEGVLRSGDEIKVEYKIEVPSNAVPSGQYLALRVGAVPVGDQEEKGVSIDQVLEVGHLVFAEVGDGLVRRGEFVDMGGPRWLTSGKIEGRVLVRNTGEIYGKALASLEVLDAFSGNVLYSNMDDPVEKTILPERELELAVAWEETPMIGVFRVKGKAEFEGIVREIERVVLVCPVWVCLLVVGVATGLVVVIVGFIIYRRKKRKEIKTSE